MPRRDVDEREDWDPEDAGDDREDPDPSDLGEDDEDDDTVPCPHCGRSVYEQAQRCPHCGRYLSDEAVTSRKPLWVFVTVIVLVALFVFLALKA